MKHELSFRITNSAQKTKTLILEPWGEDFEILSGKTFEFLAKAEREGNFEVEVSDEAIIVYAWASATVKVFCDGAELGVGNFERQTVPEIPEGHNISSFMNLVFGKSK